MEAKLAVYQLAAPCTSCRSMAGPKLDKVIDGGQKIFNLVGSAADLADNDDRRSSTVPHLISSKQH